MTELKCARCDFGVLKGVDSAFKNAVIRRDGFRPATLKIHKNGAVCAAVNKQRALMAQAAHQRKQNVWWRRLARKLKSWV